MTARVASRIGITSQQHFEPHAQCRFFGRLAHGGKLQRLTHIHKTAGQGPAMRRVLAPDQYNRNIRTILELDDDVRG